MKRYFITNVTIIVLAVIIGACSITYSFFYEPLVNSVGNVPASLSNSILTTTTVAKTILINNINRSDYTNVDSVKLDGPSVNNDIIKLDAYMNYENVIEFSFDVTNISDRKINITGFQIDDESNNLDIKIYNEDDTIFKISKELIKNGKSTYKVLISCNDYNEIASLYNVNIKVLYE